MIDECEFKRMHENHGFHDRQLELMWEDLHFSDEEKDAARKMREDADLLEWGYIALKEFKMKDGVMVCREGTDYEIVYVDNGFGLFFAMKKNPGESIYYWGAIGEDDEVLYIPEEIEDKCDPSSMRDLRHCLRGKIYNAKNFLNKARAFMKFAEVMKGRGA